jgi:hypothetical protein
MDRVAVRLCTRRTNYGFFDLSYTISIRNTCQVNINPSYQTEELRFALNKVGIKALISAPGFKKSNYYMSIAEIIPELVCRAEGRGDISSNVFPNFRHLIIFDEHDRAFR